MDLVEERKHVNFAIDILTNKTEKYEKKLL